MTTEERQEAIRTHPDYVALSPMDRILTLLTGAVPERAPANRQARRARKARARRKA